MRRERPVRRRSTRPLLTLLGLLAISTCGEGPVAPDIRGVTIVPDAALAVGVGSTVRFAAFVAGGGGTSGFVEGASWSIADPGIATVDARGVATTLREGSTTIIAELSAFSATATLEVYVPDVVDEYVAGTSYFGRNGYVEYVPGKLPVILSAPHGGSILPSEMPNRSDGELGSDRNTIELTLAVRDALIELTGRAPHVVLSHVHRGKLDPNRDVDEAAQGNGYAERAWEEYHRFIELARTQVAVGYPGGMYFDMHGHAHEEARIELGYLLGREWLNRPDASLNALSVVQLTSIREIGRTMPDRFAEILRGATSLGGLLQAEGYPTLPSPSDPFPLQDPYFTGGYSTRRHGSMGDTQLISAIQIEHHFPGVRDTDENRRAYAASLAVAIRAFLLEHFGFFEVAP